MNKEVSLKVKIFGLIIFLLTGFLMGCNEIKDHEDALETRQTGKVLFKITDAPFPADLVAEANVTIGWIKLVNYSDDSSDETDEAENEEEGGDDISFIMMELEEPLSVNLLELRNGTTAILAEMEIPAGIFQEIRLHIVKAGIVLKEGGEFDLKVPGGNASGLKIKLNPSLEIKNGTYAEVLLDFDVSRSFVMRGNMKNLVGFIFKPVVRAVANLQITSGKILGTVTDAEENAIENATLTLISDDETIISAITSEDGYYAMIGILPGDYTLFCEKKDYISQNIPISVEAGKVVVKNFVLLDDGGED